MQRFSCFALALMVSVLFSVNSATAAGNVAFAKKKGVTYTMQAENAGQAALLSELLDTLASNSIQYDVAANFDLAIVKDKQGEFVLVNVYCETDKPNSPTFRVGADKEFGEIVKTINIYKRRCLTL